jgi:hypothetical protein
VFGRLTIPLPLWVTWELIMAAISRGNTLAVAGTLLSVSAIAVAQSAIPGTLKTGYAPINQLNLYYEIRGSGAPLILLHGGLGSTQMMSHVASGLSPTHQVIAVDLQAHGRTADIDRPLSYEAMADDIASLMNFMLLGGGRKDPGWDRSGMSEARLAILPGVTHYDIIDSAALVTAVQPFLEESNPPKPSR